MVQINLFAKQKYGHSYREQAYEYQGGKGHWDEPGDWH